MKIIFCFIVLFFLIGCSHIQMFKDWDTKDTVMMGTTLGLSYLDYRQTLDISKRIDEGYYEKYNSVGLGKTPSEGRINTWFICSALAKTLIAGILSKNEKSWLGFGRESWLTLNIGVSAGMVVNNYEIGLEVNF